MSTKLKVCTDEVRNGVTGIRETCGTSYSEEECPRRRHEHVRNLKTGFCHSKFCEGTRAKSFSGVPAKTCMQWLTCPCDCHDIVSMMFQANNLPRQLMENPEYVPTRIEGLVTLEQRAAAIAERKAEDRVARLNESRLLDGGDEIHSPSGRTRKGLLDQWVEMVCKIWALAPNFDATPQWISETIASSFGVPAPSVGAVDAVLKRWQAYGYATLGQKPNRFTGFTPEGERLGLEVLKEKARLESRRFTAPALRRK